MPRTVHRMSTLTVYHRARPLDAAPPLEDVVPDPRRRRPRGFPVTASISRYHRPIHDTLHNPVSRIQNTTIPGAYTQSLTQSAHREAPRALVDARTHRAPTSLGARTRARRCVIVFVTFSHDARPVVASRGASGTRPNVGLRRRPDGSTRRVRAHTAHASTSTSSRAVRSMERNFLSRLRPRLR